MPSQPYIGCGDNLASKEEILNALYVKDNLGNIGIRAMFKTAAAANITPMLECEGIALDEMEIFRGSIGLTPGGKPAIVFISET